MGLFDTALDLLGNTKQISGNSQSQLIQTALGLLTQSQQGGGLQSLIGVFQNAGLGEVIASWVGTGQNFPISAEQVQHALSSGRLDQLAEVCGLSHSEAAGGLASILPSLIDHLTPNGQVSDADNINPTALLQQFSSLFGQT